jgi:mRNA interferase RelE/StbE
MPPNATTLAIVATDRPRYRIQIAPAAERVLSKLDRATAARLLRAIASLSVDPRPAGTRALTGHPGALRRRVGDYRIIYRVQDAELVVLVLELGHRREIYRTR